MRTCAFAVARPAESCENFSMQKLWIVASGLLVACVGQQDGQGRIDGRTDGNSTAGVPGDGPKIDPPRGLTATKINCVQSTRTVQEATGNKSVTDTFMATIDGIAPSDNYYVETSAINSPESCPANATCTNSGAPLVKIARYFNYRSGSFDANGKLVVYCGFRSTYYNAAGVVIGSADQRFDAWIHR